MIPAGATRICPGQMVEGLRHNRASAGKIRALQLRTRISRKCLRVDRFSKEKHPGLQDLSFTTYQICWDLHAIRAGCSSRRRRTQGVMRESAREDPSAGRAVPATLVVTSNWAASLRAREDAEVGSRSGAAIHRRCSSSRSQLPPPCSNVPALRPVQLREQRGSVRADSHSAVVRSPNVVSRDQIQRDERSFRETRDSPPQLLRSVVGMRWPTCSAGPCLWRRTLSAKTPWRGDA
jgi:hypothetical protein